VWDPERFRFIVIFVIVTAACSPGDRELDPERFQKRICEDLGQLDREVLTPRLGINLTEPADHEVSGRCLRASADVAFVDGFLQGLDRAWSASQIRREVPTGRPPALAEPIVGMHIPVQGMCNAEDWHGVEELLEEIHAQLVDRLALYRSVCEDSLSAVATGTGNSESSTGDR